MKQKIEVDKDNIFQTNVIGKPASRIRMPDNDSAENEDDYVNDFDDYSNSLVDKSREADEKQPVLPKIKPDPFESPVPESYKIPNTINNLIYTKARTSNINLQDMRRLNSKLNNGRDSNLDGYQDEYDANQIKEL